ncbi:hypothetical protein V6N13_088765 [Hibiscus sabdariffa]
MQWKVSSPAAADEQNALHSHVRCRLGWVCNTISTPSFAQDMYFTPPPMQMMDDQLNQDEQTPDLLHQRRTVQLPRRYDQTSSLHRQVLPRRKR